MFLAQLSPSEVVKLTDEAAKHDDRWLFVALLIIGLVAVWMLSRYFMKEISKLQVEIHEVREDFEAHLKNGNAEMIGALSRSSSVIEQNSKVLGEIHEVIIKRS